MFISIFVEPLELKRVGSGPRPFCFYTLSPPNIPESRSSELPEFRSLDLPEPRTPEGSMVTHDFTLNIKFRKKRERVGTFSRTNIIITHLKYIILRLFWKLHPGL
jgi:hypothetical protein